MSLLLKFINIHSLRQVLISISIIATIVATVLFSLILLYTDKKNNAPELQNELWSWAEHGDYIRKMNVGWYETFFFSAAGRFMYIKEFASDNKVVMWSGGSYVFDKQKSEISLSVDNSNMGNEHGELVLEKAKTIKILHKDEETVILEGSPITARDSGKDSTTVFRLQQRDLLMLPEGSLDREVKEISLLSKTGDKIYETQGSELKTVLDILNSSTYNREWNRNEIKIPDHDFNINLHFTDGEMIQAAVWINESKLKILNVWYDVNDGRGMKLFAEILKKH